MRNPRVTVPTPPPLTDEPPPLGFRLPLSCIIAAGAYAALRILFLCLRKGPVEAYAIGETLGGIAALILLTTVIAMIGWRVGGRSERAGKITFFVVFVLFLLGQSSQSIQKNKAEAELVRLQDQQRQVMDEQRAAIAKGRPVDNTKSEKLVAEAGTQFDAMAQNSTGGERRVALAGKEYVEGFLAAKRRYDAAIQGLHGNKFWDLATYTTPVAVNEGRKAVQAFGKANAEIAEYQDLKGAAWRRIMTAHGSSQREADDAVAGYLASAGTRLPYIVKLRESDAQLAQAMMEYIAFAESNRGKWTLNAAGEIMFQDQASVPRYNDILKRVNDIMTAQTENKKRAYAAH